MGGIWIPVIQRETALPARRIVSFSLGVWVWFPSGWCMMNVTVPSPSYFHAEFLSLLCISGDLDKVCEAIQLERPYPKPGTQSLSKFSSTEAVLTTIVVTRTRTWTCGCHCVGRSWDGWLDKRSMIEQVLSLDPHALIYLPSADSIQPSPLNLNSWNHWSIFEGINKLSEKLKSLLIVWSSWSSGQRGWLKKCESGEKYARRQEIPTRFGSCHTRGSYCLFTTP